MKRPQQTCLKPTAQQIANLGQQGERAVVTLTRQFGWHCLAQRWRRQRQGELDLVLYDPVNSVIIFSEVKTRRNRLITALEALTPRKRQAMQMAAQQFLAQPDIAQQTFHSMRFDWFVVQPDTTRPIDDNANGGWQITHYPDVLQCDTV